MGNPGHARGLLISVGGSAAPVAYSIEHHRPEKIIFFASLGSRGEIETGVRPLTSHRWVDREVVTTPDPQDLTRCMEALAEKLPECLANLGLAMEDLVVDYTGGTKTMSAALVLATINQPVTYSYVGGKVRTKEGLGTVLDGTEAVLVTPNPWDVLAIDLRRRLARQFNQARFAEARDTAEEAADRVGERWRRFYLDAKDLCDVYHRWAGFDFAGLDGRLQKASHRLKEYAVAANDESFLGFLEDVDQDLARLRAIVPAFQGLQKKTAVEHEAVRALIVDLAANAWRTTRLAGRSDDGVARLYSALEKLAKAELMRLGVDNSAAQPTQIPESLRDEFVARYGDRQGDVLQFGLMASYRLLETLGQPVGERFRGQAPALEKLLDARNHSLMVHGWRPVKEDVFDKMLAITLDFVGIREQDLPSLPRFPQP